MMTLCDEGGLAPRTHALVVGVGRYAHLPGGGGTVVPRTFGLGQLGAPPLSAVAFASWLLNSLNNDAAPLAASSS